MTDEGWHRAGTRNSWPSLTIRYSVRRHYFRNGKSLCGKYFRRDYLIEFEGSDPMKQNPYTDCVRCAKILNNEAKGGEAKKK